MKIRANYYQQYDADYSLDVPGEGYGGWKQAEIEMTREHTALAVMHAWSAGTREQFPGWYRAVEYLQRSRDIYTEVFPKLLSAARNAGAAVFHVVGGGDYYKECPGYKHALELAGQTPSVERVAADETLIKLNEFKRENVFVGKHNEADVAQSIAARDFPVEAQPQDNEGVAENAEQLYALCKEAGINHLIYVGFALNWCILMSPGGMLDMSRYGLMCSTIREATTAVENKESARGELHKEEALWRVALMFGFVFDIDDIIEWLGD